jgi:thiol-disulfide isomerase/thioredoxin
MATDAPIVSGQDILGGPAFDLAAHKGSYVFVAFMGLPWCGPCKLELPNLVAVANEYAAAPPTPAVDFVIVNWRISFPISSVATYAKEQGVTFPVIDDDDGAMLFSYGGDVAVPQSYIVTPSGALCDSHLYGSGTAEELMNLPLECGARAPGTVPGDIPIINWGSQPTPVLTFPPDDFPREFPTPVRGLPPGPKPLGLMSRAVVRGLAIHDAAAGLADHQASTAIRSAALKAAATGLRRMESMAALEAELGPLPPHAVEMGKASKRVVREAVDARRNK